MFARISTAAGMHDMLNYHEGKVTATEAQCIYAGNFLKNPRDLSLDDKKQRFNDLITLN